MSFNMTPLTPAPQAPRPAPQQTFLSQQDQATRECLPVHVGSGADMFSPLLHNLLHFMLSYTSSFLHLHPYPPHHASPYSPPLPPLNLPPPPSTTLGNTRPLSRHTPTTRVLNKQQKGPAKPLGTSPNQTTTSTKSAVSEHIRTSTKSHASTTRPSTEKNASSLTPTHSSDSIVSSVDSFPSLSDTDLAEFNKTMSEFAKLFANELGSPSWEDFLALPFEDDIRPGSPDSAPTPTSTASETSLNLPTAEDLEGLLPPDIFANPLGFGHGLAQSAQVQDPTMASTFPGFGDWTALPAVQSITAESLGLAGLFDQISKPTTVSPRLMQRSPSVESVLQVASPASLKRKISDASDASVPAPKRRGRPPKNRLTSASATPALTVKSLDDGPASAPRRSGAGKVIPDRFWTADAAQKATGLTKDEIMAFPNFSSLLDHVRLHRPAFLASATELGAKIDEGRNKGAESARRTRDGLKTKIIELEEETSAQRKQIEALQDYIRGLGAAGFASPDDVARLCA